MDNILLCLFIATSIGANASAPTTVVVTTQSNQRLHERLERVQDWDSAVDGQVLGVAELQQRLTGIDEPARPNVGENARRLSDADDCEANFDAGCAERLRRAVVRAYDTAITPNAELRALAAAALHGLAAHELSESHEADAREWARFAARRFPNFAVDAHQYPPAVAELMLRAKADVRRIEKGSVTFRTTRPGRLTVDDALTVAINDEVTRTLPYGDYRFWIRDDEGTSLVHELKVSSTAMTVGIDFALEARLSWTPSVTLSCDPQCDALLQGLARQCGVQQAIGISLDADNGAAVGRVVSLDGRPPETRTLVALAELRPHMETHAAGVTQLASKSLFSPWLLVPFGVGQFSQRRYVAGSVYAGIQAGLLAWHLSAAVRADGYNGPSPAIDEERRSQRNLSGGLFVSAILANIVEAVIVDAVTD